MLRVILPDSFESERKYILRVLLREFLGLEYYLCIDKSMHGVVKIVAEDGALTIVDVFFSDEKKWLSIESLPKFPLRKISVGNFFSDYKGEDELPVLYGVDTDRNFIEIDGNGIFLGLDIFGSAFFMLSRYEECVVLERDDYGRFTARSSVAYKAEFLERPIVNEYVELLWCVLQRVSRGLNRKKRYYKVIPTHDIDKPFGMMYDSKQQIIRHFAGDVLYRKSLNAVVTRIKEVYRTLFNSKSVIAERKKTFTFICEQSEKYGLQDVFFFMNSKSSWLDGNYYVDEPEVLVLIKELRQANHMIGLHPSFVSYNNKKEMGKEVSFMNRVLRDNGLPILVGARQHYLRWENPTTWQLYEEQGIPFDSTLSFADYAGFRCGTCYEYPVYDVMNRRELNLWEYPLIVMDGTLYEYMKMERIAAMEYTVHLAEKCKRYKGNFVLLWHNTSLDDVAEQELYAELLRRICN